MNATVSRITRTMMMLFGVIALLASTAGAVGADDGPPAADAAGGHPAEAQGPPDDPGADQGGDQADQAPEDAGRSEDAPRATPAEPAQAQQAEEPPNEPAADEASKADQAPPPHAENERAEEQRTEPQPVQQDEVDQSEELAPQTVSAKALDSHPCDDSELHFVINQIRDEASAPAQISVTFDDDVTTTIPLEKFTGGTAHYTLEDIETFAVQTVASATATIYGGWDGQFNLSHGPCGETGGDDGDNGDDGDDGDNGEGGAEKVTLCHATGSEQNPYEVITVDEDAVTSEDGHGGHEDDIIPAFGDFPGQPEGQQSVPEDCDFEDGDETPDEGVEDDDEVNDDEVNDEQEESPVVRSLTEQAAPAAETSVLGASVERGSLARTGPGSVDALVPAGVAMLLLGLALERSARRRTRLS